MKPQRVGFRQNGNRLMRDRRKEILMKALSVVSLILNCVAASVCVAAAVINIVSIRNSKFVD